MPLPDARSGEPLNFVFIGRLDSYKRLVWLFNSLALLSEPWKLIVVGDGPKRTYFEGLAQESFPFRSRVFFLGCLSEADKYDQIAKADLLVLPSDRTRLLVLSSLRLWQQDGLHWPLTIRAQGWDG